MPLLQRLHQVFAMVRNTLIQREQRRLKHGYAELKESCGQHRNATGRGKPLKLPQSVKNRPKTAF